MEVNSVWYWYGALEILVYRTPNPLTSAPPFLGKAFFMIEHVLKALTSFSRLSLSCMFSSTTKTKEITLYY